MGTYGTATGVVQGVNPSTGAPVWLMLVDGEIVGSFTEAGGVVATRGELAGMILDTTLMYREMGVVLTKNDMISAGTSGMVRDVNFAYVGSQDRPLIARVSVTTHEVSVLAIPSEAPTLALSRDGTKLWAGGESVIYEIDTLSFSLSREIEIGVALDVDGMGVDLTDTYLYAELGSSLYRIDIETFLESDSLALTYTGTRQMHFFGDNVYILTFDHVEKIELTGFTSVATLAAVETDLSGGIDPDGTYLYVGGSASGSRIEKIRLSDFTSQGSLTRSEIARYAWVIDSRGQYAYGLGHLDIIKVSLPDLTFVSTVSTSTNWGLTAIFLADDSEIWYIEQSSSQTDTIVYRIDPSDLSEIGTITLAGESRNAPRSLAYHSGYLYVGLDDGSGRVLKVDSGTLSIVDELQLSIAGNIPCLLIDGSGTYMYATVGGTPGTIVKIKLSNFTENASVTLNSGENNPRNMVFEASETALVVICPTTTSIVVRVTITPFARASALTLNSGENTAVGIIRDGTTFYVTTNTSPGKVVKLDITGGVITRITALTFSSGHNNGRYLLIYDGYLYTGTSTTYIEKISLSSFTVSASLDLSGASGQIYSLILNTDNAGFFAVTRRSLNPVTIEYIDLASFTSTASLVFEDDEEDESYWAVMADGYIFVCLASTPGRIVKVKVNTPSLSPVAGEGFALIDENGDPFISLNAQNSAVFGNVNAKLALVAAEMIARGPISFTDLVTMTTGLSVSDVSAGMLSSRLGFRLLGGTAEMNGHRLLDAVLDLPVLDANPDDPVDGEVWLRAVVDTTTVWPGLPFLPGIVTAGGAPELRAYVDSATYKVALSAV